MVSLKSINILYRIKNNKRKHDYTFIILLKYVYIKISEKKRIDKLNFIKTKKLLLLKKIWEIETMNHRLGENPCKPSIW